VEERSGLTADQIGARRPAAVNGVHVRWRPAVRLDRRWWLRATPRHRLRLRDSAAVYDKPTEGAELCDRAQNVRGRRAESVGGRCVGSLRPPHGITHSLPTRRQHDAEGALALYRLRGPQGKAGTEVTAGHMTRARSYAGRVTDVVATD